MGSWVLLSAAYWESLHQIKIIGPFNHFNSLNVFGFLSIDHPRFPNEQACLVHVLVLHLSMVF